MNRFLPLPRLTKRPSSPPSDGIGEGISPSSYSKALLSSSPPRPAAILDVEDGLPSPSPASYSYSYPPYSSRDSSSSCPYTSCSLISALVSFSKNEISGLSVKVTVFLRSLFASGTGRPSESLEIRGPRSRRFLREDLGEGVEGAESSCLARSDRWDLVEDFLVGVTGTGDSCSDAVLKLI